MFANLLPPSNPTEPEFFTELKAKLDRLDSKVQHANTCGMRLSLIPASARNAGGVDHQIELRRSELQSRPDRLLSANFAEIKPAVQRLKAAQAKELVGQQAERCARLGA